MIDLTVNNATAKRTHKLAALMLGVVAGVIAILVERADFAVSSNYLGYVNSYTWLLVSALLFGFWGAIITTEIQALIGLVAYTSPLSIVWPFINLIFALGVGAVAVCFSKFRPNAKDSTKLLAMSGTCALLDIPLVYLVMMVFLPMLVGVPMHYMAYLAALPIYIVLQLVLSTFLAYSIIRALKRSKIVRQ